FVSPKKPLTNNRASARIQPTVRIPLMRVDGGGFAESSAAAYDLRRVAPMDVALATRAHPYVGGCMRIRSWHVLGAGALLVASTAVGAQNRTQGSGIK